MLWKLLTRFFSLLANDRIAEVNEYMHLANVGIQCDNHYELQRLHYIIYESYGSITK